MSPALVQSITRTENVLELPGVGPGPGYRPVSFEEYLIGVGLAPRTVTRYLDRLRWATRTAGELGFDLATADARDLAALSMLTGASHPMRAQLRCALKHWYEFQDRTDAPLRAVRVPPAPRMVNRAVEPDQARRLVDVAGGWWPQGAAVLFGLFLALRREEIARAEWDRFDDAMAWYRVTGKRDKTATLPVHPRLRDELASRRGSGWVFPGRFEGRHIHPVSVGDWAKAVGRAAGIENLQTHQLRHTALTTALDNTENLRSVMEFARHERPQTTAGYTRTTKEQLLRVSEALDYR